MANFQISLGKARIFSIIATMSDESLDTTTAAGVATNLPSAVKVALNPSNNREFGILALAPTTGAEIHVNVGSINAATLTVAVTAPTLSSVSIGGVVGNMEEDAPEWLTEA